MWVCRRWSTGCFLCGWKYVLVHHVDHLHLIFTCVCHMCDDIAGQGGREGGREGWKRERKWERERGGGGEIREREGDRAWDNIVQCVYCARAVCSYVILNYIISWKLWFTSLHYVPLRRPRQESNSTFLTTLPSFGNFRSVRMCIYRYICVSVCLCYESARDLH